MKATRKNNLAYTAIYSITIFFCTNTLCQNLDFKGQLSAWGLEVKSNSGWSTNFGMRYFPQLTYDYYLNEQDLVGSEISLNTFYSTDFKTNDSQLKIYRFKLRYATSQSELQIGLQKINFGPAQLLRSLMWFDRVDPRDPLKMTDGVYSLRYKYSFLNNSVIWLWSLYGNTKTKGYEIYPTVKNRPEFGGRVQIPVPSGEFAATFHTRRVNTNTFEYTENRFALDGRWDIEIGFWFESVLQQNRTKLLPFEWNKMITLGADYTFGIGNGLYILGEHMTSITSRRIFGDEKNVKLSAFMMSYPISVLDNLTAFGFYSWDEGKYYQYLQWQRTYDNLILTASLFNYPQGGKGIHTSSGNIPASGCGIQLMLIYNH